MRHKRFNGFRLASCPRLVSGGSLGLGGCFDDERDSAVGAIRRAVLVVAGAARVGQEVHSDFDVGLADSES